MRDRSFDPRRLNVQAFVRDAGTLEGEWPLGSFERLSTSLSASPKDASRVASWSASGSERVVAGSAAQPWLQLSTRLEVTLQCQRCLQPMTGLLHIERRFRFAADEAEALRLDEETDDDVLVMSREFDLHELVEDELILALPIVPRHDACPEPLQVTDSSAAAGAEDVRPNPFAVLARLKEGGKPN